MSTPDDEEAVPMHAMTLRIPLEWHETLRERSFRERKDINDLVREALEAHFGLPPRPIKRGRKLKNPSATQ